MNKKILKPVLIIVAIILVLLLIYFVRNFIIVSNLQKVSNETLKHTNFIAESVNITGISVQQSKSYVKGNQYFSVSQGSSIEKLEAILKIYHDENECLYIMENEKQYLDATNGSQLQTPQVNTFAYYFEQRNALNLALACKISSEKIFDQDCYKVEFSKDDIVWVEKSSGIIIQSVNCNNYSYSKYQFDVVTDNDVAKPNLAGYTKSTGN